MAGRYQPLEERADIGAEQCQFARYPEAGRIGPLSWSSLWLAAALPLIAGCASFSKDQTDACAAYFQADSNARAATIQGRIAVSQPARASLPEQAWSAQLEFDGAAVSGRLLLSSPLGVGSALICWGAAGALLQQGNKERYYADLQQAFTEQTHAELPLEALFAWLRGEAFVPPLGWEISEASQDDGGTRRLFARSGSGLSVRLVLQP